MFQRQLSKKGLQTIVVEEGDEVNSISTDDLRCVEATTVPALQRLPRPQATRLCYRKPLSSSSELFVINNDTPSDTHDTLRCTRCLKGEIPEGASDDEIDETR